jgi:hypothetical protein
VKLADGFLNMESIDGQRRFKIGIIDLLTKYGAMKHMENVFKSKIN